MLYTLSKMGQVRESGKVKRAKLYRLASDVASAATAQAR
jgi:hypothetical protein